MPVDALQYAGSTLSTLAGKMDGRTPAGGSSRSGERRMFQRQKVLLQLIAHAGGRLERMRLMTLLFLARQDRLLTASTAVYGFVPYRNGPFSFAMERDIAKLAAERRLTEDQVLVALRSRHD